MYIVKQTGTWRWQAMSTTAWRGGVVPRQNLALLLDAHNLTTPLMAISEAAMGEPFSTIPFYALLIVLAVRWRRLAT